ncbi:dihydrofolate reductase family protein [Nocardia xishanensis]|uniref:dihydrofolate reductase family protein n=1 Tax=Nocardia xishanensis TaxID=238964 RepID=UPI00082F0D67|nr:dihydrofolate reductase family protein [Nocardia xishanensis]
MGKVVVSEFVSADGIIENPAWTFPFWNDSIANFKSREVFDADALLLGRTTYEGFAAAWPDHPEEGEYKVRMNSMPKHVATTSLTELAWNADRIEGDVAEGVAKLRAERNLLVFGSGNLINTLRANHLVDEYRLVIYPVLLGKGQRLFDDVEAEDTMELADSEVLGNGVILATYKVTAHSVVRPSFD